MTENKRAIAAWCLYDWANSAFTTLVVTFVYATYFTQTFAADENTGTALWSRGIVVSSLLIALLSPILGALADRGGTRRRDLLISTVACVAATAALTFVRPDQDHAVWWALSLFVVANVAFEVGMVYYNSFLPAIAADDKIGRVSGYGWAAGYGGGLVCLVVALFGFVGLGGDSWLTLSTEEGFNIRATNLLVAAWFLAFSLPIFFFVREKDGFGSRFDLRGAVADLAETCRQVRRFREIVKFLVARLIYNDGLITIFAFGGIYAAGTFGMSYNEVIAYAIVINVAAGIGAWAFGFFDDKAGGKATIMVSIVALFVFSAIAVIAPSKLWFWIAGLGIGIFVGPNQAASRSLMGRFVPERHNSEFFGFFAFSGKATAFLGPLLLGILSQAYGQRVGISVVLLFFLVGGVLMLSVDERRGIEAAAE
ncbi:MAG: MFS transporter [Thermoanaerobaculia bacterium]